MHPLDDNALTTEEAIWDLTQAINVKGVWYGCKHAIFAMRQNPTDVEKGLHAGGSVINTASFVGKMGAATPQIACGFCFLLLDIFMFYPLFSCSIFWNCCLFPALGYVFFPPVEG